MVRPVRDVVVQTVSDSALTLQALSSKPDGDDARSVVIELEEPVKDLDAPVQALAERLAALPGVTATAWSSRGNCKGTHGFRRAAFLLRTTTVLALAPESARISSCWQSTATSANSLV